jgi:hypothetical protein
MHYYWPIFLALLLHHVVFIHCKLYDCSFLQIFPQHVVYGTECSLWYQKKGHSCQTSLSRLRDFQRKLLFPRVCVGRERQGFTIPTPKKRKWTPSHETPWRRTSTLCILQLDGVTSRTSKGTQEHLDEEVLEFIKKRRVAAAVARLQSYVWIMCMWDSLSKKVYRGCTEKFTEEELKQTINECCEEIYRLWT